MKYKILSLLVICSFISQSGYSQWYKTKFVIGSFADPRLSADNDPVKDEHSFALAKAAYINFLSGPQFDNSDFMNRKLDLASKFNMHMLVTDNKLFYAGDSASVTDRQKIKSKFTSLNSKRRAAMAGYYLGGELPIAQSTNLKKFAGYFKSGDPSKIAYSYLLPSYAFGNHAEYEKYLDSYLIDPISSNKPEVIAYDCYPFINVALLSSYFYNLGVIKEKAGDRPVWYYIESTYKTGLPDRTAYEMRFMAFCPLAYGSKGAIYFTYESIPAHYALHYYDALIDPSGSPTPKYATAKLINHYLTNIAGPIIMKNKCVGTYHVSQRPTNEVIPASYILSKNNKYVTNIDNENVLVGIFKSEKTSKYYLLLINKTKSDIPNLNITVPSSKIVHVLPGSSNYQGSMQKTVPALHPDPKSNTTTFQVGKLPGGEMTAVEVN